MKKTTFFQYFGGKYYLAPKLIEMFPQHSCYVEVFGGAGNVLFQKGPSEIEVFNDINSDITNLFRVLREDFDEFHRLLHYTPYSRETYEAYKSDMETETDPTLRAVLWYAIACQSFSGVHGGGWTYAKKRRDAAKGFKNKVDGLPWYVDRLRGVIIENRDFEFVLDAYDDPDVFFYLDPPYVPSTRRSSGYDHEMTYEDHERLIELISPLKASVMLSGYQNDLYDSLGWHRYDLHTTCFAAGRTRGSGLQGKGSINKNQQRVESVYMNYELSSLLFDLV